MSDSIISEAQKVATEILAGSISPYEGGRRIWIEFQLKLNAGDHRLDPFVYWTSEYEETNEPERMKFCEHALCEAASALLNHGDAVQ
ncbi:MAG: hypothetical protein ACXWIN_08380 [Burkholderiaceae bacterium]